MATAQQIKSLLKSYSDSDGDAFLSVALQIAAHEARSGKGNLASDLKKIVDEIRDKQKTAKIGGAVPISRPTGELGILLAVSYPKTRLSDMVLSDAHHEAFLQVIHEYRQQSKLREHGLSAKRKLLLVGPPGVGKTMSSMALAGELKLPHFTVQLHSLITKYLGETATKLHAIFEAMTSTRGVYLFDEFDAIGSMRADRQDVGEIRRVLNSFLQFLEQDDSDSLIIAATNLEELLDEALFRRFDEIIRYQRPAVVEIEQLMQNRLAQFSLNQSDLKRAAKSATGLSHAEICRACDEAAKDMILKDKDKIDGAKLNKEVLNRKVQKQNGV